MPIRIQRIEPEGPPLSSVPYARATPEVFGAGIAQEGVRFGEGLQRQGLSALDQLAEVQKKQRQSQQALDGFALLMDARLAVDTAERAARARGDFGSYETEVTQAYQTVRQETLGRTKDPAVKGFLTKELGRLELEGRIKARATATGMYVDTAKAALSSRLTVARDMILGTADPIERARLTGLVTGAIRAQSGLVYPPDEAEKLAQKWEGDLQEAQALVDMRVDPVAAEERLLSGGTGFEKIAPDQRARMAGQARGIAEARERDQVRRDDKAEKDMAKALEAERKAAVDDFDAQADAGTLTYEALQDAQRARLVMGEDYRRLLGKVRQVREAGGRTDESVYNGLELRILDRSIMGERARREIRAAERTGGLAQSGARSAASLMRMVREEEQAESKDITKHPLFDQGLNDISLTLRGGKGPLESLEPIQHTRLRNAIREYHDTARSGKVAPHQLPEAARTIVDRYLRDQPQTMGDPDPETQLRYRNPADLLKARQQGLIPESEFNRQAELLRQVEERQRRAPAPARKGTK